MVAEVIINSTVKNLNKSFDYNVPTEFVGTIKVGDRVLVPFGNSKRLAEGFIIGFKQTSIYKVKDIVEIQKGFCLTEKQIELAKWIARRYFCNVSDCIKMMLPPGTTSKIPENRVKEKNLNFVYLKKDTEEIDLLISNKKVKSEKQIRAINFLRENDGILEKNGFIEIVEKQVDRNPFVNKNIKKDNDLQLTTEQKNAYDAVVKSINNNEFKEFLIYGVTGSRENRNIFTINKKSNRKK